MDLPAAAAAATKRLMDKQNSFEHHDLRQAGQLRDRIEFKFHFESIICLDTHQSYDI
jgi:hypothetical protein